MAVPPYITEINEFYDWLETNQLPKSAIALWHGLMHINNKARWDQRFTVAISTIESKTGFKRSELFEARNILEQKGRLKWKQRGGNLCAEYELIFFSVRTADAKGNAKANTVPDAKANTKPTQTGTIIREDKTTPDKTRHSFVEPPVADTTSTKKNDAVKKEDKPKDPPLPFWKKFVDTWEEFYLEHKNEKYAYADKDFKCLKSIYQFLQKRAEAKKYEWTEENLMQAFTWFLKKAYEKDNWTRENFSIPKILSQFNEIANGTSGTTNNGKPAGGQKVTGEQLNDAFAAFYQKQ